MALGKQIRFYREKLSLTLEQLSALSGVDPGTINALENRDSARSKYSSAIAKALGITVEQLENGSGLSDAKKLQHKLVDQDYKIAIRAFRAMCVGLNLDESVALSLLKDQINAQFDGNLDFSVSPENQIVIHGLNAPPEHGETPKQEKKKKSV